MTLKTDRNPESELWQAAELTWLLQNKCSVFLFLNILLCSFSCFIFLTIHYVSGPPFTHQWTPEHIIYYGQPSCDSDMDRYLESLKFLWRRRSQSRETPVIINTMGWVKGQHQLHPVKESIFKYRLIYTETEPFLGPSTGFGFQLLVDMIRFFPVSHVVQLDKSELSQSAALTPEFLRTAQGYQTHPPAQTALDEFTESHPPPRSYTHLAVQSDFQGVARQGTS